MSCDNTLPAQLGRLVCCFAVPKGSHLLLKRRRIFVWQGANASTTTIRFTHLHVDLVTRIGHGASPCRYYLRPIAASSDLGQFQQSHWSDLVQPLGWSTAPNVTDPSSLASLALILNGTYRDSRPCRITNAPVTTARVQTMFLRTQFC